MIARLFAGEIVCRHGFPEELLSDRGANFLSNLIKELYKILGVTKINTAGYTILNLLRNLNADQYDM